MLTNPRCQQGLQQGSVSTFSQGKNNQSKNNQSKNNQSKNQSKQGTRTSQAPTMPRPASQMSAGLAARLSQHL